MHLRRADGTYACGVGSRWASQIVTSVTNVGEVTCRACVRIAGGRVQVTPSTGDEGATMRALVSRRWAEDWDSAEDSAND